MEFFWSKLSNFIDYNSIIIYIIDSNFTEKDKQKRGDYDIFNIIK